MAEAVRRSESGRFQRSDVERELGYQIEGPLDATMPSDETIRRTLAALAALDVLEHVRGSPYYEFTAFEAR